MSPDPKLVAFTPEHAEVAHQLHRLGFPDPWPPDAFVKLLETGACGFVALSDHAPIGLILARAASDEAEILTFLVDPHWRNRGVGTKLMMRTFEFLTDMDIKRLYLEVAEDNKPALALYKKLDFTHVGERAGYYQKMSNATTALILMKELTEK